MFSHAISVVETLPEGMKVHKNNYQEHTSQLMVTITFCAQGGPKLGLPIPNVPMAQDLTTFYSCKQIWFGKGEAWQQTSLH